MGTSKLWLLVLLINSGTLAQDDGVQNQSPSCLKDATRFKHLRKYVYNYEAETSNGVPGTADSQSGSRISCKVELEVPQLCSFILRVNQCTLREVHGVNSEGKAILKRSTNSDEFASALSKFELKFSVPDGEQVLLYPDKDEDVNVLNIKRGIISALLVPAEKGEAQITSSMDTVFGKCSSEVAFKNKKGATEVTIDRNLKTCDQFSPMRDYVSPLALVKGLNSPLSTLISSSQSCQYSIDSKKKHVSEAVCTEKHLFLPFSHKNKYGIMAQVTQSLKLADSPKINSRIFDEDASSKRGLAMEKVETKSPSQRGEEVVRMLEELQKLDGSQQQRANLFHKLVTGLRGLHNSTLSASVPMLMRASGPITIQALIQCGTPECFSAVFQTLRNENVSPVLADAVTYGLGLLPSACPKIVRELLNMAQYQQSRASFYALSYAVNEVYLNTKTPIPEVRDVAEFMASLLEKECSGDDDKTYMTLKAIGNMGNALDKTSPAVKRALLGCAKSQTASLSVQKAAIQAFRKMQITDEVRSIMLQIFQDGNSPIEKRLAAYLVLMKDPTPSDINKATRVLMKDRNEQVKSFVASHIANILNSEAPDVKELKGKVQDALKGSEVPTAKDFRKFSQSYQLSKTVSTPAQDDLSAKLEGNLIFDGIGYMPEEAMLQATLNVFGEQFDIFELGFDGKGFEPTLDALFGEKGFFPDSGLKALYWLDGNVPEKVSEVLFKWLGVSKNSNQNQDFSRGMLLNIEKLIKEVRSSELPEAKAYLRILGEELGYVKLNDFKVLGNILLKSLHASQDLPAQIIHALSKGTQGDLFLHYIFMDNEFDLPTGAGFQLQVSLSGIVAPGAKAGLKIQTKNMQAAVSLKPAVAIEFVTHVGIHIPAFARNGVQMNTNIFHESGTNIKVAVKEGQVKFSIPAPKQPTQLFSFSNKLHLISTYKSEVMPSIIENRESWSTCVNFFTGLKLCNNVAYSNASSIDAAPYYPLTGETKYELEIQPTFEVDEYTASATYDLLKNEDGDMVDTLKFTAQAVGSEPSEATLTIRYNRNKITLSSNMQIPKFDVDVGLGLRVDDESTRELKSYSLFLDVRNQKVPEISLAGHVRYDGKSEAMLEGVFAIPRLLVETKVQALLKHPANRYKIQLDSSATVDQLFASERIVFTYDNDKLEIEWNTGSSSGLKTLKSVLDDATIIVASQMNDVLDRKVANADMTLRHIISQALVASNNWLQKASKDIPYATELQEKVKVLQEWNIQNKALMDFIPEKLFLTSDVKLTYVFNKDTIIIDIPLPFAGKSSDQLRIPRTVRSPKMEIERMGLKFEPMMYNIPSFTIPKSFPLRVPLLGVFSVATNIHSNYYNWTASYTGGNYTRDVYSFIADYKMKADSALDLLSYKLGGTAQLTHDPATSFVWSYTGNLHHSLLDSSFMARETVTFNTLNPKYEGSLSFDASSKLGAQASISLTEQMTGTDNRMDINYVLDGQLKVASLFSRIGHTTTLSIINLDSLETTSVTNFDSSYLQATNKIIGRYADAALDITSTTDVQSGALANIFTLSCKNSQLTLKSDTTGRYHNLAALNKMEVTLTGQVAAIRSEYQADYKRNRYYTLLSGSLGSNGLELNADINVNNQANRAAHKATLEINGKGLSTSATTNINFSPLTLGNEFNAGIDASGAMIKMIGNGRYQQNSAKITVDGKAALMELILGSTYQSTIMGIDSKNIFNFKINKEGLKFSNNLMGSHEEMKLECNHDLNLAPPALSYTSKFEGTFSTDKSYKQSFDLQIKPYILTALMENDFKYGDVDLTNRGNLGLEPFKLNLNGNMRGAYRKDEIKHTYEVTAVDLTVHYKAETLASIRGSAFTHNIDIATSGLMVSFSCSTNYACNSLHFTNAVRSKMAPFVISLDAQTTGDGRLGFLGESISGELYSKFLFNSELFAFTLAHDYRGSTEYIGASGNTHNTLLQSKINLLFTPSEQSSSWKLKSKFDQNGYTQDVSAYNNVERMGVELSGGVYADFSLLDAPIELGYVEHNLVDLLGLRDNVAEPQEFSISGFVKYDKNKDMHVIHLPFLESLPVYFEQVRGVVLSFLQSLQNYLKSINIDQVIKKYKASLDKIPQQLNDYVNTLDIESQVNDAKEKLLAFAKEYKMTAEDLENALENAKVNFESAVAKLQDYLSEMNEYLRQNVDIYELGVLLENIINEIVEKLKELDKQYGISKSTIQTIQHLQKSVHQLDVNELGSAVASWVEDMDAQYQIRSRILDNLQALKTQINNINAQKIAANLKQQLKSIKIQEYVEKLKDSIPIDELSAVLDRIKDIVLTMLEDFQVTEKINAFAGKMQNIITTYEVDKHVQALIDKFIKLVNQYKVKETVKKITSMFKNIDFKSCFESMVRQIDEAIQEVKSYDYQKLVEDLNTFLDTLIKKIRSFDYEKFVDHVNERLMEITQKINSAIKDLELPQKAEALKEYLKDLRTAISNFLERLGDTKLAALVEWYSDLLSSTGISDLKKLVVDILEDVRDRIYQMDLQMEFQMYLQKLSHIYKKLITHLSDQWEYVAEQITTLGAEYDLNEVAEKIKAFGEQCLRALMEATFQTPEFTVPLTDLHIPSVTINMNKLREFAIPARFDTPEFTILNTYKVPSYTIDLNEIKQKIVQIIDQMMSSEFQWPSSEAYLKDLKMKDILFADMPFLEINFPELQLPKIVIPKLNLDGFELPKLEIPEYRLPQIPHTVTVPAFGKLSGEFRVKSPFFSLTSSADVQNTTISEKSPEFVASVSAQTTSKYEMIAFTLLADARVSAPGMAQLIFKESVKAAHKLVKVDHSGEVTFSNKYVQGKVETMASLHTEKNSAQLHNDIIVMLQKKITVDMNTRYSHKLNIPEFEISSQLELQNEFNTLVEAGKIAMLSTGKGNWKWSCPNFSDEGTHESNVKFIVKGATIEISGSNKVNAKYVKIDQTLKYESGFLSFASLEIKSDADSPFVGRSVLTIVGKGQLDEIKAQLTATHNADLAGRATGTISNSLSFLFQPFEISLSTNNNGNLKVAFPMKLTGKIEFLNNYALILNSAAQQVSWQVNGRFNQYKYSHTISSGNTEDKIDARVAMNGEANLDFLNVPITIPELSIPYSASKTPEVKDFSLWERTGLKNFLKTTKQSFDLNVNLQYKKNKEMHAIPFPLGTVYEKINQNMKTLNKQFEKSRDNTIAALIDSYNKAKTEFEKYKVENAVNKVPRIFQITGYTIPVLNIEVSPFTAELPAFGYVVPKEIRTPSFMIPVIGFSVPTYTLVLPSLEMPVLHVPVTLRRLTLPRFKLPNAQNEIFIPAMGDLTYDFSFKSNVISLTTAAGLYNQTDISARFSSSCTSVVEALQYKLDGTTSLTRKRGLKLATALSLSSTYVEGNHESSLTFAKKNIEAAVTTVVNMLTPTARCNFKQELGGNTKSKPTVSSKINLNCELVDVTYGNIGKGTFENTLSLEGLSNYFSVETSTNGEINGILLSKTKFSGKLNKEVSAYLNGNGARSTMKLEGNTKIGGVGSVDIKENLAVEASLQRVYAVWEHTGKNNFKYPTIFSSEGTQSGKATLEMTPCSWLANVQLQVNQPNMLLDELSQNAILTFALTCEKQTFSWNGVGQASSIVLSHDLQLANDKAEVRLDVAGSMQGYVDFLKSIVLPVYDKNLWDILKFDITTSPEKKQYFNSSASIVYTKNKEGFFFGIPVEKLADGVVITVPQLELQVPQWMKDLPGRVSGIKMPDFNRPQIPTPEFRVPFTNLQVPSYDVDFSRLKVPKMLTTLPFDLTLPALPKVRFPKVDIGANYLMLEEYKIPYFEVTVPKFELTLPEYTLPKRIEFLDFNEIAKKVADFDLPTITIPEQKIEFPPLKLNLPGGIFIPAFGALTGSVKVATPIYTTSWSTTLKNATNALEATIDATCSSTVQFLEYDLDVSASGAIEGGALKLTGKGTLAHLDLSADWQEDIVFDGLRVPTHLIRMDITSPTFADVQFRYQHEGNKISSFVSSPSAGTLGLLIEKDTSVIRAKVYSRTPSSPGKDLAILKSEISLKNPEQIQIKTNWKEEAAADILSGTKNKLPQMSDAIYNFVNKYHNEHLGMDLKSASMKMKRSMENSIDEAYLVANKQIDDFEQTLRTAASKAEEKYQSVRNKAELMYQDQASPLDYRQIRAVLFDTSINLMKEYQKQIKHLIDAAIKFLKVTKFQLPGQTKQYTGEELYTMAMEQLIQKTQQYSDALIQYVNELEITVPGTDTSIQGKQVIEQIKKLLKDFQQKVKKALNTLKKINWEENLKQISQFLQENFKKVEGIFQTLKNIKYENINMQAQEMYRDAMDSDYGRQVEAFVGDMQEFASQVREMSQSVLQDLSEKLQQLLAYIKTLRAEYWDPNIIGWSVKYYEVEEKVIELLQQISVKDLYTKYIEESYELALRLINNLKELLEKYGKEYYDLIKDLVTDAEGKGRKKMAELTALTQDKIRDWSVTAKENAAEFNDYLKAKLQEAYIQLSESYDRFIAEATRLIDLSIEKYNSLIEYIMQLLQSIQTAATNSVKPYIATRKGELKVDVPHPFKWQSFNEVPQLRDDVISKKVEIIKKLIQDGADQSSKKWEELQGFIDQQLAEGKLSVQQIIENIQQRL